MTSICREEAISYQPEALDILASQARGSARELVMAVDAVSNRGHLTPALLKTALSLDWTEQLVRYGEALLASDLAAQFAAIGEWLAAPAENHGPKDALLVGDVQSSQPPIQGDRPAPLRQRGSLLDADRGSLLDAV